MLAGSGRSEGKQTLKEATGVDAAPPKISELNPSETVALPGVHECKGVSVSVCESK